MPKSNSKRKLNAGDSEADGQPSAVKNRKTDSRALPITVPSPSNEFDGWLAKLEVFLKKDVTRESTSEEFLLLKKGVNRPSSSDEFMWLVSQLISKACSVSGAHWPLELGSITAGYASTVFPMAHILLAKQSRSMPICSYYTLIFAERDRREYHNEELKSLVLVLNSIRCVPTEHLDSIRRQALQVNVKLHAGIRKDVSPEESKFLALVSLCTDEAGKESLYQSLILMNDHATISCVCDAIDDIDDIGSHVPGCGDNPSWLRTAERIIHTHVNAIEKVMLCRDRTMWNEDCVTPRAQLYCSWRRYRASSEMIEELHEAVVTVGKQWIDANSGVILNDMARYSNLGRVVADLYRYDVPEFKELVNEFDADIMRRSELPAWLSVFSQLIWPDMVEDIKREMAKENRPADD
jgi:hypothetical protein